MEKNYFLFTMFLLGGLCISVSSCSLFNPPVVIPCYGHIDSIPLIIKNSSVQGTSANAINTAWVYVDDNPVGAFQLPSTFPIIAVTGQHKVTIFAGVKDDGEAGNRIKYPFYTSYMIANTTLTQGSITNFKPVTSYAAWTKIPLLEDFDYDIYPQFHKVQDINVADTDMFIIKTPDPNVYQGSASGEVCVDISHPHYRGVTDTFNIPNNGDAVFMELNYKTNSAFTVGMYSQYSSRYIPVLYIDTSSAWKKMYINLQPTVAQYQIPIPGYGYELYIEFDYNSGGPAEQQLFLDNIKLERYN